MPGAYVGGSGHMGPETSQESEEYRDSSGLTDEHQVLVVQILERSKARGATALEVRNILWDDYRIEKGRLSTALTNLHILRMVERLKERRGNHYVYVLPQYIDERLINPYIPQQIYFHSIEAIENAEALADFLSDRTMAMDDVPLVPQPGDHEVALLLRYAIAKARAVIKG